MLGGIQRVEVVELRFDIRTIRDGEAHLGENAGRFVDDGGNGVDGARAGPVAGQGEIERAGGTLFAADGILGGVERIGDGGAQCVERLPESGLFGGRHIAQPLHEGGQGAIAADVFDAAVFDVGRRFAGGDFSQSLGLEGGKFGKCHGRGGGVAGEANRERVGEGSRGCRGGSDAPFAQHQVRVLARIAGLDDEKSGAGTLVEGEAFDVFDGCPGIAMAVERFAVGAFHGGVERVAGDGRHHVERAAVVGIHGNQRQNRVENLLNPDAGQPDDGARSDRRGREIAVGEHELIAVPHGGEGGKQFRRNQRGDTFEHGGSTPGEPVCQ